MAVTYAIVAWNFSPFLLGFFFLHLRPSSVGLESTDICLEKANIHDLAYFTSPTYPAINLANSLMICHGEQRGLPGPDCHECEYLRPTNNPARNISLRSKIQGIRLV